MSCNVVNNKCSHKQPSVVNSLLMSDKCNPLHPLVQYSDCTNCDYNYTSVNTLSQHNPPTTIHNHSQSEKQTNGCYPWKILKLKYTSNSHVLKNGKSKYANLQSTI